MSVILRALESDQLPFIPAAPESAMPPGLSDRMPDAAPPAPWECTFDSFLWVQRAGKGVGSVLPEPLRASGSVRWLIGAFVQITESPVGPYSEVYAGLVIRTGVRLVTHIPFMAVDSMHSLRGGRANWALPKTLAAFEGGPSESDNVRAKGAGWQVSARARAFGPRLPMKMKLACAQVRPDGTVATYNAVVSGRPRFARLEVEVASNASLPNWMPPGRHVATHWSSASLQVSAAVTQEPQKA